MILQPRQRARSRLILIHHHDQPRRPPAKLSRRDPLPQLAVLHLQHVAKYPVGEESCYLVRHVFEAVLKETARVVDVFGEIGVIERRVGPRVTVIKQVEENEAQGPDIGLARVVGRREIVPAFLFAV